MFLKSYFLKPDEKFSLEDSPLDNFKAQGFPDHKILDYLKVDYFNFEEIVKNWETMQDFINLNKRTNFVKTHNAMCKVSYQFTSKKNTKVQYIWFEIKRCLGISFISHGAQL